MYLIGFPLLVIPFAIYNIIEFVMPGSGPGEIWTHEVTRLRLASGTDWTLSAGDLMVTFTILLLIIELLKSTRPTSRTIMDHLLSTLLFVVMIIEFLLVKQAASATFFLLIVVAFVDVVGGYTISIRSAQRSMQIDGVETIHRG
jgi:hypothetical protein